MLAALFSEVAMVRVIAKQTVVHGALRLVRGAQTEVSEATAAELERAGIVERVDGQEPAKALPEYPNKMAREPRNKTRRFGTEEVSE